MYVKLNVPWRTVRHVGCSDSLAISIVHYNTRGLSFNCFSLSYCHLNHINGSRSLFTSSYWVIYSFTPAINTLSTFALCGVK